MVRVMIVGGVWDECGGRASGYIGKLFESMSSSIGIRVECLNGGRLTELYDFVRDPSDVYGNAYDCILWLVDVDNGIGKLLPTLASSNQGKLIIRSKLNGGRYSDSELYKMMWRYGTDYLIEFNIEGGIRARLMGVGGTEFYNGMDIPSLANILVYHIRDVHFGRSVPIIGMGVVPTGMDVGAFGVIRKHHRHEGVDIYCDTGSFVSAMEEGFVVGVYDFTGEVVGSPWWNDTSCIMVEGINGVINYGEVESFVRVGQKVTAGQQLGIVKQVLKKDKGRPMSMLHIERYIKGTVKPIHEWGLNNERPECLLDPTTIVYGSRRGRW